MTADLLSFSYACLGGFFMGSYPVPIKHPVVLAARVHPVVFQGYKSLCVLLTGCLFVLCNGLRGTEHVFEFTWWGIASATMWVPAGLCTIAAVPIIGVGLTVTLNAGIGAALSFLVFWLMFGEQMRIHGTPKNTFYLAPWYLLGLLLGMTLLVAAQHFRKSKKMLVGSNMPATALGKQAPDIDFELPHAKTASEETGVLVDDQVELHECTVEGADEIADEVNVPNFGSPLIGMLLGSLTGVLTTGMYGVITIGKRKAKRAEDCEHNDQCSGVLQERFNPFGSWMATFGIGAALVTLLWYLCVVLHRCCKGRPVPALELRLLWLPGTIAGMCWTLGACMQTAAVARGGSAVMMPVALSVHLVTSGAWGVLYYQEVNGWQRIFMWGMAVVWTLAMMTMLSLERLGNSR